MEIGTARGTPDAPKCTVRHMEIETAGVPSTPQMDPGGIRGEWDVEAPSPTVGMYMVRRGIFDAPGGRVENGEMGRRGAVPYREECAWG